MEWHPKVASPIPYVNFLSPPLPSSQFSSPHICILILTLSVPCTPLQLFPYRAHTHTITYIIQIQVIKKNREIKLNVELLTSAIHYRICTHCLFPTAHYHLSPCWSWWYFNPILTVFDTSHNHILRKAGWRISAFNVRISALRKVIFYSLCFESGVQRGKGEKILDV